MIVVIAYSGYLILLLVGHLAAGVRSQGKESAPQSKLITELVLGSLVSRFGLAVRKLGWFGLAVRKLGWFGLPLRPRTFSSRGLWFVDTVL